MSDKATIFSGIQPSGKIHIGNYFGAIQNWVNLQNNFSCNFCIVDQHAITVPYKPDELRKNILDIAATYIACGLDPKKSNIFVQSYVPEHTELAWYLTTLAPIGELERMTQYKDKSDKHGLMAGLFSYPLLMAADILLYHATHVPVGDDQYQHVELTRKIAKKFNNSFGDYFTEPEHIVAAAPRIKSLSNPEKKMSKSDESENSYILIDDEPDVIRKKIKKAVTDSGSGDSTGSTNLITILELCGGDSSAFQGDNIQYGDLKDAVAESLIAHLTPIREKKLELLQNKSELEKILEDGSNTASKTAQKTMAEVRNKMGLR